MLLPVEGGRCVEGDAWAALPLMTGDQALAFWTRVLADPSFVYVVQGESGTPIKVGVAKDVRARMAGLQCGNPQKLRLLYALPGDHELEWQLHRRLHGARIHGEWFGGEQIPPFLEFVADLARKMYEARNGDVAPHYWQFGGAKVWKRRRPKPKPEPELVVHHVEPEITAEERQRRLHANWTRPRRPRGNPNSLGTL